MSGKSRAESGSAAITGVPWSVLPRITSVVSRKSSPTSRASALWSITEKSLRPLAPSSSVKCETVSATERWLTFDTIPDSLVARSYPDMTWAPRSPGGVGSSGSRRRYRCEVALGRRSGGPRIDPIFVIPLVVTATAPQAHFVDAGARPTPLGSQVGMTSSFYSSVNNYVDRAAALLDLDDDVRLLLADPYRQVDMQVPINADDGSVRTFRGYRVQHNGTRGRRHAPGAWRPAAPGVHGSSVPNSVGAPCRARGRPPPIAAYMVGITRVAEATRLRGLA